MKINYDAELDSMMIIIKEGPEEYYEEIIPGFNVEFNELQEVIGIEIFNASSLFKIKPISQSKPEFSNERINAVDTILPLDYRITQVFIN